METKPSMRIAVGSKILPCAFVPIGRGSLAALSRGGGGSSILSICTGHEVSGSHTVCVVAKGMDTFLTEALIAFIFQRKTFCFGRVVQW